MMKSNYLGPQLVAPWYIDFFIIQKEFILQFPFFSLYNLLSFGLQFSGQLGTSLSQFSNFLIFFNMSFSFSSIIICLSYCLLFLNKFGGRTMTSLLSFSLVSRLSILDNISSRLADPGIYPSINQKFCRIYTYVACHLISFQDYLKYSRFLLSILISTSCLALSKWCRYSSKALMIASNSLLQILQLHSARLKLFKQQVHGC